ATRGVEAMRLADEPGARVVALPPPRTQVGRGLGETIQRRGSTRRFGHAALTAEELGTALWAATRGLEADVPAGVVDLCLVVNAVEGVPDGAYGYRPTTDPPEPLAAGDFPNRSADPSLHQPPGGAARPHAGRPRGGGRPGRSLRLSADHARPRASRRRRLPQPVRVSLPGAAARRRRGGGHLFSGAARRADRPLRRSRLPPGESGS